MLCAYGRKVKLDLETHIDSCTTTIIKGLKDRRVGDLLEHASVGFNKVNMDTILKKIMLEFPRDTDITYPLMMEVISAGVGRLGKHSWVVLCGWLDNELFRGFTLKYKPHICYKKLIDKEWTPDSI
ncbi:hypothetical protein OROHE_012778 [Orobanche hederae]